MVHPGHGGCRIREIQSKNYGGQTKRYYALIPTGDVGTIIWAPVDGAEKIGLRDVMSQQQADQVLRDVRDAQPDWIKDHTRRRQEYEKVLKTGSLADLGKMVKELTLQGQQTKLNQTDQTMLPRARNRLLSEISLAKGIAFDRAANLMDQAVRQNEQP